MRFCALIFGVLAAGVFSSHTAVAQFHRKVRYYNHQGRPFYRGPLRVTLGGGTALYDGDLGNKIGNNFLSPAASLGLLYRLSPHWHIGSEASYIKLGSRDQALERGLAFTTTAGVGTVMFRYDLLADESVFAASVAEAPVFQLYAQAGGGLILFNPHAYQGTERATDNTSFLTPERNDYPAVSFVVPIGGGFSVRLTDRFSAGLEGNYYFTSTDHLDETQQRLGGASANNDGFGTAMLKLGYSLQ